MPDTILRPIGARRYQFDFWGDEKLYSISFEGDMPPEEIQKMLKEVQARPYRGMADAIWAYLEHGCQKHGGFFSAESPTDFGRVMGTASSILHSGTCHALDRMAGGADFYYAAADCQQNCVDGSCRGCYLAVRRMPDWDGGIRYHVVGQTFSSGKHGLDEHGLFAVRAGGKGGRLHDMDRAEGELVLPSIGCVDVAALLLGIDGIKTREQARKAAEK